MTTTDTINMDSATRRRGFSALFMLEMWERFGYYGMAILMVVFLKEYLNFSDSDANLTWGAFGAMVYAAPVIGGWIGDKVLGTRRTTVLGAAVLGLGYLLLAIPGPIWLLFLSLGVIATGNGLFKANPNNLVSKLYEGDNAKLDGAFTIYYMAINLGAFASQILTPIVRIDYGWRPAFGISAIGLAFGILNFLIMKKHLKSVGSKPDFEPLAVRRLGAVILGGIAFAVVIMEILRNSQVASWVVWSAAFILLGIFIYLIINSSHSERNGLIAVLLLTAQTILFFIFYQQMSTSLTLFALRNVVLDFFGYHIPPEQFQVLNPFWIWILSPILAVAYNALGKRRKDLNIATKFFLGFVMLSVGFFIYGVSGNFASQGLVSPWWMVWGYFFQSFGELLISGLGLAMVARFVGPHLRGFIMGTWFLAVGISQYFGSMVANLAKVPDRLGLLSSLLPPKYQALITHLNPMLRHWLMATNLDDFRTWIHGGNLHIALTPAYKFAALPSAIQTTLRQLNHGFRLATLPLYTHLFLVLGGVAIAAALLAAAMLPLLKRLGRPDQSLPSSLPLPEHETGDQPAPHWDQS